MTVIDGNLEANTMERTALPDADDETTKDQTAGAELPTEKPPAYSTSGNTAGRRVGPNEGYAEKCVHCCAKSCVTGCVGVCCICLLGERP
mmetsp:Transcript_49251/g.73445  ORF Transcript_49251/g.73445 Transcript_49251/m.73445 type:complete len:90 (-) Transcript_49251:170-439(-)